MRLVRTDRHPADPTRDQGQSLVEFALVLLPLFFILLGIIQFGLIFNSYVTITNAAREGARSGSVYIYDATMSKAQNDLARNNAMKSSLLASMNMLSKTAPQFTNGSTWTQSGLTYTNGDIVVTYAIPTGVTDTDSRVGQRITVRMTYHQDLVVPLIPQFLPKDAGGRLGLQGEVTMVVN
jgi:Flp pilus assembly protein TadG